MAGKIAVSRVPPNNGRKKRRRRTPGVFASRWARSRGDTDSTPAAQPMSRPANDCDCVCFNRLYFSPAKVTTTNARASLRNPTNQTRLQRV